MAYATIKPVTAAPGTENNSRPEAREHFYAAGQSKPGAIL